MSMKSFSLLSHCRRKATLQLTIEQLQSELRKMQSEVYIKPAKEVTEDRMIDDFYEQFQVHDTFVESSIGERDNDRSSVTDLFIDAHDPNGYEELHELRESTHIAIKAIAKYTVLFCHVSPSGNYVFIFKTHKVTLCSSHHAIFRPRPFRGIVF
uniref:AlNc14C218G9048 protein n=1 Tax=Albugo laibachii Nc14 TaxID=890382 RepID=F0WRQ2_9STRA|nr:AlNc14C218G9048 [Albugo laibachii Nc14]|eukprot:CCA24017.1 AlNc14C218G9048 [Albugo laibachii Nc14]